MPPKLAEKRNQFFHHCEPVGLPSKQATPKALNPLMPPGLSGGLNSAQLVFSL
jgi:hypothetical protein